MFKHLFNYFSAKPASVKACYPQELDRLEEICADQWWGSGTLKRVESEEQQ